jgi:hypothetical protein
MDAPRDVMTRSTLLHPFSVIDRHGMACRPVEPVTSSPPGGAIGSRNDAIRAPRGVELAVASGHSIRVFSVCPTGGANRL